MGRAYRLVTGRSSDLCLRGQRVEADADIAPVPVACPGEDSLLAITAMYSKRNLGPNAAEPLSAWHRRMLAQGHFSDDVGLFAEALSLHERLRFDPTVLMPLKSFG